MINELQVGTQAVADGTRVTSRAGRTGEQIVSELQARYYEQAYRKNIFTAYASAVATSVVGTGMIGLQLTNNSSTTNLVLLKCAGNIIATSATTTSLVMASGIGQVAAPTGQTAATRSSNNFIGGAAPVGLATNAGTFTNAPTAFWPLLHNTAAIAVTGEDQGFQMDFEGSVIVPPNTYVAIAAVGAAVAASGSNLSIMWMEVPV